MNATDADLVRIVLAILNASAMGALALHFGSETRAEASARRLYEDFPRLRAAFAFMLTGVVVIAEVDAFRWLGTVSAGSAVHRWAEAAGHGLLLTGLLVFHTILLLPPRPLDPRLARRAAWRERARRAKS